jgi:hypothetical protein
VLVARDVRPLRSRSTAQIGGLTAVVAGLCLAMRQLLPETAFALPLGLGIRYKVRTAATIRRC